MRILVVGSGAREHALATYLAQSPQVEVHCAPGNAGMATSFPTYRINPTHADEVVALAVEIDAALVVIGPEAPLVAGVADALTVAGIAVFGPTAAAAQLEASKSFAKEVMHAAGVPTAAARSCRSMDQVQAAMDEFGSPYVIKDDGLAAGKGVVVTGDQDVARTHAAGCLAGPTGLVVVEDYLAGPEISLLAVTDGTTVRALAPAQDFKRLRDGDQGPNTGGMGSYSPLPWAPADVVERAVQQVLQPVVNHMAERGTPFCGALFAGLALTAQGLQVIEFNARFGDPETQSVLARLETPLHEVLYAAATSNLHLVAPLRWRPECAVTVVMAAAGYPDAPQSGAVVSGLEDVEQATVFHAGTLRSATGDIVVAGGRVLAVTALGADLDQARQRAYRAVDCVRFEGEQHRSDIALSAARGEVKVP